MRKTPLMQRLGLSHPIVQAPMAGGGDTPALVAAVCEAGGIGFIGAAYLTPAQIGEAACEVGARTSRPFGINLFAPQPPASAPEEASEALACVAPFYAELGLPPPSPLAPPAASFDDQFAAALDSGAAAFSFTLGVFREDAVAAVRQRGMLLLGTATTVEEALVLERTGVDAVVAQGSEAGGHRATFKGDFEAGAIGTMSLVPQIVDAVGVPVIASGGIMDGRGIAAALALGADAVQMGTAFLTCDEAGIPEVYKNAILRAGENDTRMTRAFSGRPARGIVNRFMSELHRPENAGAILPFLLQNGLTRPLRTAAAREGRAEFLSLWAGQGTRMARRQSATALVERLSKGTAEARGRLIGMT